MKDALGLACLSLCLFQCFGCNQPTPEFTAEDGKAALLDLMRSEDSPFDSIVLTDMENGHELKEVGDGEYDWGPFTISTKTKTYKFLVETEVFLWDFSGRFLLDDSGSWQAVMMEQNYADAWPEEGDQQ